jgi:hypothetical protein
MRFGMAAMTAADGSVFIFGGEDEDANPLTSVVKFDPATSTLSRALDLATARSSADVARLTDGRLLVVGGGTGTYGTDVSATSEIVGLPAQRRDGPTMSASRFMHTVTRLSNGKVLVFGGLDASKHALATAEIFE